jgi:hypothetical protein
MDIEWLSKDINNKVHLYFHGCPWTVVDIYGHEWLFDALGCQWMPMGIGYPVSYMPMYIKGKLGISQFFMHSHITDVHEQCIYPEVRTRLPMLAS